MNFIKKHFNDMFSIYTSAFNVEQNDFDWIGALTNFCSFADEVVVAVNTSNDNSLGIITDWAAHQPNIMVKKTDFSYEDPALDGKIKNAALQETTKPYKIGLDLDERIRLKDKEAWKNFTSYFLHDQADAVMLPVLNLYENEQNYKDIAQKWYLHRAGLRRGVVNFAKRPDGTHDITKSDSCELIDSKGNLVERVLMVMDPNLPPQVKLQMLKEHNLPFVIHYGYVNLARHAKLNANFWKRHWSIESGDEVDVPTEVERFTDAYALHGLELDQKLLDNELISN